MTYTKHKASMLYCIKPRPNESAVARVPRVLHLATASLAGTASPTSTLKPQFTNLNQTSSLCSQSSLHGSHHHSVVVVFYHFFFSSRRRRSGTVSLAAEAKRQVEEQRVKREREEALEREREVAAAELRGKKYEGRRKAGDLLPSEIAEIAGGRETAPERRKFVKAKRSGGGSGTPADGAGSPFAFGGGVDTPRSGGGSDGGAGGAAASPFAGFSLLATPTPPAPPANASGVVGGTNVLSGGLQPKPTSILSRLSGGAFTGSVMTGAGDAEAEESPPGAATNVATNAAAPPGLFGSFGAASVAAGAAAATPTLPLLAPPKVSPCTGSDGDGDDKSRSAAAAASSPHIVGAGTGGGESVRTALAIELGL